MSVRRAPTAPRTVRPVSGRSLRSTPGPTQSKPRESESTPTLATVPPMLVRAASDIDTAVELIRQVQAIAGDATLIVLTATDQRAAALQAAFRGPPTARRRLTIESCRNHAKRLLRELDPHYRRGVRGLDAPPPRGGPPGLLPPPRLPRAAAPPPHPPPARPPPEEPPGGRPPAPRLL